MPFNDTGVLRRQIRTCDADAATAYMAGNVRPMIAKARGTGAEFDFEAQYYQSSDFMAGRMHVQSGWSLKPLTELDVIMVWMGQTGRIVVQHEASQGVASAETLLITSGRSTRQVLVDETFDGFVIAVCSDVVRQAMTDFLGYRVSGPFDFTTEADRTSRLGSTLTAYGAAVHAGLMGSSVSLRSPIVLQRSRDAFVNLVLMTAGVEQSGRWGDTRSSSVKELRRAEDFMQAHASEPIGIGDVAAHAGVSVRSLQYAFKRHRGTTPLAVLNRFRLEGVRDALSNGEPGTVAAIANRWGFSHASRFAAQYHANFGEKPSETLARRDRKAD